MPYWNLSGLELEEFRPGIMSQAELGKNLIMAVMKIGPDMEDAGHQHPFDQCGLVLEGRLEMFIGDERLVLEANEAYFIPGGQIHGWKTFDQPAKILDISAKV